MIDADVLAYRSCIEHEEVIEVEDGYWTTTCNLNKVKDSAKTTMEFFMNELGADKYIYCLTDDKGNYRKSILSTYKEKRTRNKRPIVLKHMREWLLGEGAIMVPDLEGDDVMGIIATDPTRNDERIIVSIDKDMRTIPGQLYTGSSLENISQERADYYHLYQTLIGDPIDGYYGVPGVGPVTAKKALEKHPSWKTVLKVYEKAGLTEEYALANAQCAKILTYDLFDRETQKPILWTPEVINQEETEKENQWSSSKK